MIMKLIIIPKALKANLHTLNPNPYFLDTLWNFVWTKNKGGGGLGGYKGQILTKSYITQNWFLIEFVFINS